MIYIFFTWNYRQQVSCALCIHISHPHPHPHQGSSLVSVLMLFFIPFQWKSQWKANKMSGRKKKWITVKYDRTSIGDLFLSSKCQVQIAQIHLIHKSMKQRNPTLYCVTCSQPDCTKWITMRFVLAATTITTVNMFHYTFLGVSKSRIQNCADMPFRLSDNKNLPCKTYAIHVENCLNINGKLAFIFIIDL